MGFLDKVKRGTDVKEVGGVNPFATKASNIAPKVSAPMTSGVTPAVAVANKTNMPSGAPKLGAKPTIPTMVKPGAKPSIPSIGKPVAPSPVKVVQPKVEQSEEVKDSVIDGQISLMDSIPAVEEKVEANEVPVTEEKVEEVSTPVEEVNESEKTKEEKKTSKAKSTRSTKASSRKKADAVEASTSEEDMEEQEAMFIEHLYKMPVNTMSFSEAVKSISVNYEELGWPELKAELIRECDEILIEQDMSEGAVKKVNAQIDALRNKIWVDHSNTKALCIFLSNSSSKEAEGMIERTKFLNMTGANEVARKRSGIIAAMNFQTPDGTINLYQLYDIAKAKLQFYTDLEKTLDWKSSALITVNAANKRTAN